MNRTLRLATMLAALVVSVTAGPLSAATTWPAPVLGGAFRYWVFDDHNDLRDPIVYWIGGPWVVQLEYWNYLAPDSHDQFRPELHWRSRDRRRSGYDIGWRGEYHRQRFMFSTEQMLVPHWVGRVEADPIVWTDSIQVVVLAGADYYWGSYHFASAGIIRDPRSGGLWSFPMRVRLATESNDWVQLTLTPTTERTLGWSADGKWRALRLGIERNSRYDFTDVDNLIFTVGFETPFPKH
ncbi:MAG: hypothetical protein ACHQ52_02685 [Candidatus Eisenbacteria bacterium]